MSLGEAIVGSMAGAVTTKCLEVHTDDIKKTLDSTVKTVNKAVDEGWERDYNAGGVSSWSAKPKTATP